MKIIGSLLLIASLPVMAVASCRYDHPVAIAPQLYNEPANGRPQGLIPALADRVSRLSGCQLTPRILPLARRNALLMNNKLQLMLLAVQNQQLERQLEFIPLFRLPLRATVIGSNKAETADALLADNTIRIGVLNGVLFPPEIERILAPLKMHGRLEYSNDRTNLYLKLQHGRLHAVLETTSWLYSEQSADSQALRFVGFQPPVYLAVGSYLSRSMPEPNRSLLRAALQQMLRQNEIQPLVLQYLPQVRGHVRRP